MNGDIWPLYDTDAHKIGIVFVFRNPFQFEYIRH